MKTFSAIIFAVAALTACSSQPQKLGANAGGPFLAEPPTNFPTTQSGQDAMQLNQGARISFDVSDTVVLSENSSGQLVLPTSTSAGKTVLANGGQIVGDGGINTTAPITANHFGEAAGATAPTVAYLPVATNGNPFDGGITLGTGSNDLAGTIIALANACTTCAVADQPLIQLQLGTAPGTGNRCIVQPGGTASAALTSLYTESDGGGVQLWLHSASTTTNVNYVWTYLCNGL